MEALGTGCSDRKKVITVYFLMSSIYIVHIIDLFTTTMLLNVNLYFSSYITATNTLADK